MTTVDNHRHCQATVLGATGTGRGNGLTWHTIYDLALPYLDAMDRNWKSSFLANKNITDDLADILTLINAVAGKIPPPVTIEDGDLISIVNNAISVKNNIPDGYQGPIGISGSKPNRQLVKQEFSTTTSGNGAQIAEITFGDRTYPIKESAFSVEAYGDGDVIAKITYGGTEYAIRGFSVQPQPPTPGEDDRYVITEDGVYDIILSGGINDGEPLDYTDETRYVVTENGHDYDIGVSGYGDDVILNYNED